MVRSSRRAEYFPVDFIEPAEGNEAARGFDLASSSVRREAMDQARDTGEMRGTAPVRLVQETGDQAGVLVFLPVHRDGTPTGSVEDRRANLEGFVVGVFRIGDLVERALAPLALEGIDVALYDMSAPAGNRLLAWHPSRLRKTPAPRPDDADAAMPKGLHFAGALHPAGRMWLLLCTPAPDFLANGNRWQPREVLAVGLAFTVLLAAYLAVTMHRTAQIKSLARFPSETPDPVLRIARNGEVLYANVSAAGILELPGAAPEAVRGAAQQAFASGKQVTFEVADADRIFSFSSSLPVPDGNYVNLYGHDITERKRAEEALEEAKRKLEELATTDELTGLANRRRFMEVLEAEFQRSRRYGGRLALAMVDVDRFKSFNDAHGHAFGDRVLVEVAKRLAAEARQTDVVARLGGDEFAILMPETSADEAVQAAERIRKAVSKDPISDGKRSALAMVSVGIGTVQNGKAGTPESLLKQADDAMYAAKEAGRNRVCLAPSEKAVSPAQ